MDGKNSNNVVRMAEDTRPVKVVLEPPSLMSRYVCASAMVGVFAIWGKVCCTDYLTDESAAPGVGSEIHSWKTPALLTTSYLLSLPVLRYLSKEYLSQVVDVKLLLKETMIVYNGGQVVLNAWMVYRFLDALINKGHPFIGDLYTVHSGTTFAIWIHYMDKYLEFFDTFFMVLRGRMDQVRPPFSSHFVAHFVGSTNSYF
jgi:elongation of very long chain fatty acids protein 4